MSNGRAAVALLLLLLLLSSSLGCSSSYVPATSPRLSIVMEGGRYSYVRDGKKFDAGVFGGDIDEAVRGNPKAEKYARQYKNGLVTGFVLTMLGTAGLVAGLAVAASDAPQQPSGQPFPPTGPVIALTGAAIEIVGVIVTTAAFPHQFDAVNVYNDGVAPPPPAPSPQPPPPAEATPQAL
jgi:hypothetical protein